MPCLPFRPAMSAFLRAIAGHLRGLTERDLIEQSVIERLVKAAFAAGLLWAAIAWAW